MHLGFQEYLAAREIRSRSFEKDSAVLAELAGHYGESWWQEVILLLLALEDPSRFEEFMAEVVKRPAFAEHPEMVGMCLDDALSVSTRPFLDLLGQAPGKDKGLWSRQLVALRALKQMKAGDAIDGLRASLTQHPSQEIRGLFEARAAEARQKVLVTDPGGVELVFIQGGRFMMGSPEKEYERYDDEGPQHPVTVPDFYIGRYPVTNEEYGRFLASHRDVMEPEFWGNREFNQPKQPVVGVRWKDARRFAGWIGGGLPSEAEWEYACRAGTTTRFYSGDKDEDLDRVGWYDKNSGGRMTLPPETGPEKRLV
jgi:hypothetical protein